MIIFPSQDLTCKVCLAMLWDISIGSGACPVTSSEAVMYLTTGEWPWEPARPASGKQWVPSGWSMAAVGGVLTGLRWQKPSRDSEVIL